MWTYSYIRPYLQTGDIILFHCNTYSSPLNQLGYYIRDKIGGIDYSHAGIVYRPSDDELYILEVVNHDQPSNDKSLFFNGQTSGLRIALLDDVMHDYSIECHGDYAVKFIQQPIDNVCIEQHIPKYSTQTFSSYTRIGEIAITDIIMGHAKAIALSKEHPDKMFCTQFVYDMLRDCGVMNENAGFDGTVFFLQHFNDDKFSKFTKVEYSKIEPFSYP